MKSRYLVGLALSMWLLAGCEPLEMRYTLNADLEKELDIELSDATRGELAAALDQVFGTPREPKLDPVVAKPGVIHSNAEQLAEGAASYRRLCMHCHGLSGDGNGPTAGPKENRWLNPRPRDYRRGAFKFTSTDKDTPKPTRDDLLRTLKNGVPGTSMPSFALYDPEQIERILDYVILLSMRGETERFVVGNYQSGEPITADVVTENAKFMARFWSGTEPKIVKPKTAPTALTEESVANGKKLYMDRNVQCLACHGPEGRGDGLERQVADPSIKTNDVWGDRAKPANLTLGVYRGGGRPIDLFRRIHAGIKGTPMPSQAINLKEEQIWDLVNYVRMLPYLEEDQASSGESSAKHK